jgi:hypothetical protein
MMPVIILFYGIARVVQELIFLWAVLMGVVAAGCDGRGRGGFLIP